MGPLLLKSFNFNSNMDKKSHVQLSAGEITYSFLNFNSCTVEV